MFTVVDQELEVFLKPTFFINSDSEAITDYTKAICNDSMSDVEKAIALFYAVRDDIKYDLFGYEMNPNYMQASYILEKGSGYCVSKSIVFAACARAAGVPCRLGFADVVNHLNPGRLHEFMRTNIFAFHGYAELLLDGRWVKATPSFDARLCEKAGYFKPEFDGYNDTTYPAFNKAGQRHMEYISYYGSYSDVPVEDLLASVHRHYPHFCGDSGLTVEMLFIEAELDYQTIIAESDIIHTPYIN